MLHPSDWVLTSAVSWLWSCLVRLARDRLRCDQTASHRSVIPVIKDSFRAEKLTAARQERRRS